MHGNTGIMSECIVMTENVNKNVNSLLGSTAQGLASHYPVFTILRHGGCVAAVERQWLMISSPAPSSVSRPLLPPAPSPCGAV